MGIIEIIEIIYTGIREIIEIMDRLSDWAWPFFALIFIIIFNKPIFEFLKRLKTLKIFGTVLETRTAPKQPKGMLLPQVKEELEKSVEKEKDSVKFLFNQYMKLFKTCTFEQNFNIIYGTQIKLLEHLSKKGALGDKYTNLENFYWDFFMRTGGKTTTTREGHLGFLEMERYIEYASEDDEQIVKITPHGNNFLSYIKKRYKLLYKYKSF